MANRGQLRMKDLLGFKWPDSDDDSENEPRPPKAKKQRFQTVSTGDMEELSTLKAPKSTEYSTKWAMKNFQEWKKERNATNPDEPVPEKLLEEACPELLNKWLSFYVAETRNTKGQPYPPTTLYQLLCGVLRYMRSINHHAPDFLNKQDSRFKNLQIVIDNTFKRLRTEGVGCSSKHTEIITKEEENTLWESGVLGISTPNALLRAVFFLNGKNFCLRGRQEHRSLRLSQLKRYSNPDRYMYTENASKNRQGGLNQLKLENKSVPVFATPAAGIRCHVRVLDLYLSKLPPVATEKDFFYWRPHCKVPRDPLAPWFTASPLGKNIMGDMIKNICKDAGIAGKKTNHSLRATGASELFAAGVPERIIQERTGHRSIEALRLYEHPTEQQHQAVSTVLASRTPTSYASAVAEQQLTLPQNHFRPSPSYSPYAPMQNFHSCTVNIYTAPVTQNSGVETSFHSSVAQANLELLDGVDLSTLMEDF